jgi:hypothetical protein
MLAYKIDLHDTATPAVAAIRTGLTPEKLSPVIGRSARNTIRTHLFGVDRMRPNALGGARTHFYASAARGPSVQVQGDVAVVSIASVGIRQRLLGGTIKPRAGKKFLTIPATAEAHGKRASEFDDLVVVYGAGGQPIALAHAAFRVTQQKISALPARLRVGVTKNVNSHGGIVFWLRRSVTQQPDPSVLPTVDVISVGLRRDASSYLKRITARFGDDDPEVQADDTPPSDS